MGFYLLTDSIKPTKCRLRYVSTAEPWSCCDLDLWPFNPNTETFMHVPKCINVKSLMNFNPVIFTLSRWGKKVHFPACCTSLRPQVLIFSSQNFRHSSLSQNAPMLKVWWKYVQPFSRYCVNNVRNTRTDAQTDTHTAQIHNFGGHIKVVLPSHMASGGLVA